LPITLPLSFNNSATIEKVFFLSLKGLSSVTPFQGQFSNPQSHFLFVAPSPSHIACNDFSTEDSQTLASGA
jgi:hypothetical protein